MTATRTKSPQCYLSFPANAGEPLRVLRGFESLLDISPGASTVATFTISQRDRSVWDVAAHAWRTVAGQFTVAIGASSRDIRLTATFMATD